MQMLDLVQFKYCPRCGKPALQARDIKACQCVECGFWYYHNPVPAAVAIIEDSGRVMLTTRANDPQRGMLALPGGFIDYEESLEDGMRREIREELGLNVRDLSYLLSHWDQYVYRDNTYNTLVAYFVVQVENLPQASAADDVSSFRMIRPEEINPDELAFEADRLALKEYARFCAKRMEQRRKAAYSHKAEKYARYRWDYAQEAVNAIYEITGASNQTCLADIGAGTGILTRHFVGRVGQIFAIEPNSEMRRQAELALGRISNCSVIDASSEATSLPDASVDVICVAQAIHWFEPEASREEFKRILKPGGWLVLIHNHGTDSALGEALRQISTPDNGVKPVIHPPHHQQEWYYFGAGQYQKLSFPFELYDTWEAFFGGLLSASYTPDQGDIGYANFEKAARTIFEHFNVDGYLPLRGYTEVIVGRPLFSNAALI